MKKFMNSRQFAREFPSAPLQEVYLFLGEEEGEKEKVTEQIAARLIPGEEERRTAISRFNLEEKGEKEEFMAALDFVLSSSMFSERRVAIVRDIDRIGSGKNVKSDVERLMKERDPSVTIVLTSVKNRPPAVLEPWLDSMKVVQFWKLFDRDILGYIRQEMDKRKIAMEDNVPGVIVERTGNDIRNIDEAIEMIASYAIDEKVTGRMVRQVVADLRDTNIFEYIDMLFLNDPGAVPSLKRLLDENVQELAVVALVMKKAAEIEECHRAADRGDSPLSVIEKRKYPPRIRDKQVSILEKTGSERLKRIVRSAARAEVVVKTGGSSRRFLDSPLLEMTGTILS
jgi:DNA polymerase III delta subunit